MRVKMILPALTEAWSPLFRPIKYSLFPPLGLAALAAHLSDEDEVDLQDEHVERLRLDDRPDLVVIQVYITSARRAYALADHYRARGSFVALGGLHVTSLPAEAAAHADAIFLGPGDATFPEFLADLRAGKPRSVYRSLGVRTIVGAPRVRRDLIKRDLYLVPNSIVVSRGCPHHCAFCYKDAFFEGGSGFYTQRVDEALAEIERLPGRHLYFLDDHLFGDRRFAAALFDGMGGMGRIWQAAGTVNAILAPSLLEKAAACGLRSLFVGFETLAPANLRAQAKTQNLHRDYGAAIRRLHDMGVMVNGSFVFGMDEDGPDVFDRTVGWAISQGIETATFHVLTPYPSTVTFRQMEAAGRLLHRDWDLYDTRHCVYRPARMTPAELESGYWRAYRDFYRWGSILRGAAAHDDLVGGLRHAAYASGWKKFERLWHAIIRVRQLAHALPVLEAVLTGFGRLAPGAEPRPASRDSGAASSLAAEVARPAAASPLIVAYTPGRRREVMKWHITGALAFAAATAAAAPRRGLEIYWVDVEGGGATLLVTPARESVLIDTGFPGDRDASRIHRVATQAAGLTRIDHVIVTHFHIDHFGGLASLARLMPIGTLHERYLASAPDAERAQPQLEAYKKLEVERRSVVQPGGRVELKGEPGTAPVGLEFLAASGQFVEPRATGANAACKPQTPREPDPSDNKNSVVSRVTFGRFRFFDGGDLTWDSEAALVCPRDRVGPVDVYQSNHHASDTSNNPLLLQTLRPTVAVVNNGPRKGGEAVSLKALRELKSLRALYQVHRSLRVPDGNTDAERIANADESCDAHFIKLSVEPDGSAYTVWVPPTGHRKSYETAVR